MVSLLLLEKKGSLIKLHLFSDTFHFLSSFHIFSFIDFLERMIK